MATQQRLQAIQKEGRLALAKQAYNNSQSQSYRATANTYDVSRDTLKRRQAGILPKLGSIAKNRLLTPTEEEYLMQRILSMDQRGIAPSPAAVRTMASLLASQHGRPVTAGKNWVYAFVNRHDELKSKFNRKYDYQRALCEDPELIRAWFRRVQSTITQFGILLEDIYNFDETGF